ncbi:DUF6518 family protein [Rugosimonospora africana]|uniref:Uncharacterized protein n=1 Tax=Rugosimonospora africana TaxID=556532 RepID=A0A8J3R1N8_9ACTN|nr:DUF6518 family protein [Rugosimonospora africana]GIH20853.1 hypothetical protein Raf01_90250 [Rugosimonospora africana]
MIDSLPDRRTTAVPLAIAAVAGLAVGGVTLLMQGTLPGVLNHLGNSGAVWSLAAFGAGALLPVRGARAALAGTLLLAFAVVGYYGSTTLFLHDDVNGDTLRGPAVWICVAAVAGPIFGTAGALFRGGKPTHRAVALGAIGAVFLAEALYLGVVLHQAGETALMAGLGVLMPPLLGRSAADRLRGLAALVPLTLLGALAEGAVFLFTVLVFR